MNIQEITQYIFLEDPDQPADLAFVFGTWDVWQESIERAAQLYKDGLVPKVLVSSGANPVTGVVEGDLMANDLEKLGVPEADILVENKSTNTLENVLFSKALIDRELGLTNVKVISAVVKNYHARRALLTLRKHLPYSQVPIAMYVSSKYPMTKETWSTNETWKKIVLGERDKIEMYAAKGDIASEV